MKLFYVSAPGFDCFSFRASNAAECRRAFCAFSGRKACPKGTRVWRA